MIYRSGSGDVQSEEGVRMEGKQLRAQIVESLDAFAENLLAEPEAVIAVLVRDLDERRRSMTHAEWRAECSFIADHHLLALLLEDPYTRDARQKHAGYAGDARTLDYVYLQSVGSQSVSDLGQALFRVTTSVSIADAVRKRSRRFGRELQLLVERKPGARATSLACGHCRELDLLDPNQLRQLEFWGIDHDPLTLARCRTSSRAGNHEFVEGTIGAVIKGRISIPSSDIVYASGLFDYLDDEVGSMLLHRMIAALNPGGHLLVANLAPANEEIGYLEAAMDWWMTYRTPADLERLAQSVLQTHPNNYLTSVDEGGDGRVSWLALTNSRND